MSKTIYLAGSMEAYAGTNKAREWRRKATYSFKEFTDFKVISPVDYYDYGEKFHKRESEVMRFDLRKVKESDIILVNLDNIRKSLGTSDEIIYAYTLGKPIIGFLESDSTLTEKEIISIVHPWKYEQIDRIETGKAAMRKAISYIITYYG